MFSGMAGDFPWCSRISVCCTERFLPHKKFRTKQVPIVSSRRALVIWIYFKDPAGKDQRSLLGPKHAQTLFFRCSGCKGVNIEKSSVKHARSVNLCPNPLPLTKDHVHVHKFAMHWEHFQHETHQYTVICKLTIFDNLAHPPTSYNPQPIH